MQGEPVLRVPVTNTGGLAVDIVGSLSLSGGPGGVNGGPFRSEPVVTLAPGQSGTVVFTLASALANGPWQALVTLQSGPLTKSARYKGDFSGGVSPVSFPVGLVAGVAVLVLIGIAVLLILRKRRRGPGQKAASRQPEDSHV